MADDDIDDDTHLADATRDELYARAQDLDVQGRSSMTKAELREAVGSAADDGWRDPGLAGTAVSRVEDFRRLAESRAAGGMDPLPRSLTGEDRRLHVRQTLREDHATRIATRDEDAAAKFDELAASRFSFFRGTALLFYRDMAGDDAWMPTVLTLGDVHPENFGIMPNADNVPIFGVNDFDEALYAPFTWDVKRGAVGFLVAADVEGGKGRKKRRKIARRFVRGYVDGIRRFAEDGTEQQDEVRMDNAPDLIVELFEDAMTSREEWLAEDYLDEHRRGFRADDELVPVSSRREEFQDAIDRLVEGNGIDVPARAGDMQVKDVCIRRGQGTASLGLDRYYVLIEGPAADGTDDLIIELKQARTSALSGLAPPSRYGPGAWTAPGEGDPSDVRAERIAHAQGVQLVRGDVFYGSVTIDGRSFMSRERAPFREDIDLDDLSTSEWKDYAEICGGVLAHAHALSDESGAVDHDIEPMIVQAVGDRELFVADVVRFAEEAHDRMRGDHKAFIEDHAMGAFRIVDRHFA